MSVWKSRRPGWTPLKKVDFVRFVDCEAVVKLRVPLPGTPTARPSKACCANRKARNWSLEFEANDGSAAVLNFTLADVDKAHLVPQVDFRVAKDESRNFVVGRCAGARKERR
jgi:ribosome maturation factor RimP